jgi:hypothetical protein
MVKRTIWKANNKWAYSIIGILAIIWVLIRLATKPSRINYPCMKAALPIATSFILYATGLIASAFFLKKAFLLLKEKKLHLSIVVLLVSLCSITISLVNTDKNAKAKDKAIFNFIDPIGSNLPIGEAKGIFPGRVIWVHNPDATNENCKSKTYGDGYFLDKNCDQDQVDHMLSAALLSLTGMETEAKAWEATFKFFNQKQGKGEVGYQKDETIFIKVNAVHAWSVNSDMSIKNDASYGNVDTSPQAILAMLRQLVNVVGVAQENIYIGDPFTHVFKHAYEKFSEEFPKINYITRYNKSGRYQLNESKVGKIVFSDKGTIMEMDQTNLYQEQVEASYMINIPALKGHRWGGVTFFAKNHFGSHTAEGSWKLHPGLHRIDYDKPLREEYRSYRVMVDLMAHEHLGGKSLIYFGDMLWGTSYEHDPPMKFRMSPFNNDWSSSILLSFDPVAISSVALDIYQAEITEEDLSTKPPRYAYVRFPAVDDYLHQAASKEWWPNNIVYDPEGDGTEIGSLGVHEHWNNSKDMQYSRNLGTGEGIELIRIAQMKQTANVSKKIVKQVFFPNPFNDFIHLSSAGISKVRIYSFDGKFIVEQTLNAYEQINTSQFRKGIYIIEIENNSGVFVQKMLK